MPTVVSKDRKDAGRLAAELVRAAGAEAHLVRTITAGRTRAFEVPDSVYEKWQAGKGEQGEVEQARDDGAEPDSTELAEPDRNGTTEEWAEFVRERWNYKEGSVDDGGVDGLLRRELIELHDKNLADAADAEGDEQ